MKVKIKEKFEITLFNPATRQFEGGSWHARVTINGKVNMWEIKKVQNAIDEFDHSTVVPIEFVTLEEIQKISQRYTVTRNANSLIEMLVGISKIIIDKIKEIDEKLALQVEMFEYWRDNDDVEIEISHQDINNSEIEIIKHEVRD